MKYLMCLDKNFEIQLNENKDLAISDLQEMLDAMVYLLKSYNIDDEEIIDAITSEIDLEIEEVE